MEIEELDALAGKEAAAGAASATTTVRAQWRLSVADDAASQTGTCTARQPVRSMGIDELALAWSRALADISSALAAAIFSLLAVCRPADRHPRLEPGFRRFAGRGPRW
jgi:hypothetical protein